MEYDHFLHRHPMTRNQLDVNQKILCNGCKKSLSAEDMVFWCRRCQFYLDFYCWNLPKEIQNFFHICPLVLTILSTFTCNACLEDGSGFSYRCERCNFHMHVGCAQRPEMESNGDGEEIVEHFTHWHPLRLVDEKDLQVGNCGICEKRICFDSASAAVYGCEECNFFLHKSCMINIPRQINNHSFHPSCTLVPVTVPSYLYPCHCDGCWEISSRLVFCCGKCDFQLDVKCALLPTLDQSNKDADEIQYVAHKHPLIALRDINKDDHIIASEAQCRACGENCSLQLDQCFGCRMKECNFFIHETCVVSVEFAPKIEHLFHPLHPLTLSAPNFLHDLSSNASYHCRACLGSIDNFLLIYRCDKCNFNLHFDCAQTTGRQLLLKCEGHSHPLIFFDKTVQHTNRCDCGTPARNCFFRCVACEFDMHLYCHPSAPKTIKHNCHLHPLSLAESPFEFELISPKYQEDSDRYHDEFYCDVCEEKRDKKESVYYCKECKFIAEIRCVISEILPPVIGSEANRPGDGLVSLEEENLRLNNEIAMAREREKLLELEVEQLKTVEEELESIRQTLVKLETDRYMLNYKLNYNLKETNISNGASTSEELP